MDSIELLTIAIIILSAIAIFAGVTIPVIVQELNTMIRNQFTFQNQIIKDYKELNR